MIGWDVFIHLHVSSNWAKGSLSLPKLLCHGKGRSKQGTPLAFSHSVMPFPLAFSLPPVSFSWSLVLHPHMPVSYTQGFALGSALGSNKVKTLSIKVVGVQSCIIHWNLGARPNGISGPQSSHSLLDILICDKDKIPLFKFLCIGTFVTCSQWKPLSGMFYSEVKATDQLLYMCNSWLRATRLLRVQLQPAVLLILKKQDKRENLWVLFQVWLKAFHTEFLSLADKEYCPV